LENCIFYISPMYEFSHGLGQLRTRALQQTPSLFDHLSDPDEQRFGRRSGGGWHLCALAVSSHVNIGV
jgi:hypothetical protein